MLNCFSFHLISSHRSFSWKLLTSSHCHRSLCNPISSQLISCLLSFHLISALRSSCHLISAYLKFIFFEINLLSFGISWLFISCQNIWSIISFSYTCHSISSQTQQDTACRRHEKFRVVVSAVSDPCARWDTHSKPSRREAPTQKGFYTAKLYTQQAFTQRILYTQKLLHTANFYTQKLLHTEAFTHSQLLHRETLTQS